MSGINIAQTMRPFTGSVSQAMCRRNPSLSAVAALLKVPIDFFQLEQ